jgi:hypothetical protein
MLEAETLDMNRYREQKDKLEYEAMVRNSPTTKQKRERDSMPSVPDANLIPGEIEVGTKDVQYASMRPPVSS